MVLHLLSKHETLDHVAGKYGLASGELIFYARCNKSLRQFRSRPTNIKAGDTVIIPGDAVEAASRKLDNLKRIKQEFIASNDEILKDWERQTAGIKNKVAMIDVTATVLTMFVNLGAIVTDGMKAMKLSGELLEKASDELAVSAIEFAYDPIKDVAKDQLWEHAKDEKGNGGIAFAIGKEAFHLWTSYTKPSYYAEKYTGVNIEDTDRKVKEQIRRQNELGVRNLDEQIARAQAGLMKQKKARNGHLQAHY